MEISLENWIYCTCEDYLQLEHSPSLPLDPDSEGNQTDENKSRNKLKNSVLLLGKYLFPHLMITQLLDLKNGILRLFQIEEVTADDENDDLLSIIKLLLQFVVSPHCEERENFVSHILSLSPEIQEHLMEAIQSQNRGTEVPIDSEEDEDKYHNPTPQKKINRNEMNIYCDLCPKLKQELEKYRKEITSFVQRERQREEQYKSENSFQMHKIMDLESLVTEKSNIITQLSAEVSSLTKKDLEHTNSSKERSKMSQKISDLQDQVDSLIQMSKRADIAEKQVEKLREKLDRLDGVSEQLKAETSAHNETHVTLLQYEQELNILRTAKQHLEEYRKRCVENEIQINDLKIQLKKSEDRNESLLSQSQELMAGNEQSSNQTKILTAELLNASEEIRNHERGVGVGESLPFILYLSCLCRSDSLTLLLPCLVRSWYQ
jgi:DNA repair exonuclease SbcCD ATPase subunit